MSVTSQRTSSHRRLIDFHRWMLMDSERMRTFSEAIRHAIQPGQTVLDIGTGTGILAILAVKAGARRVYAMDACSDIMEVAQELAVANDCADRITFLHGDSRDLSLPRKVDVVISETLGQLGLTENIHAILTDAVQRHLKPQGVLIPQKIEVQAAIVAIPWDHTPNVSTVIDWTPFQRISRHRPIKTTLSPSDWLSRHISIADIALERPLGTSTWEHSFEIRKSGEISGIGAWFIADLGNGVRLSTGPESPLTHWHHVVFPVAPHTVKRGERGVLKLAWNSPAQWQWALQIGDYQYQSDANLGEEQASDPRKLLYSDVVIDRHGFQLGKEHR